MVSPASATAPSFEVIRPLLVTNPPNGNAVGPVVSDDGSVTLRNVTVSVLVTVPVLATVSILTETVMVGELPPFNAGVTAHAASTPVAEVDGWVRTTAVPAARMTWPLLAVMLPALVTVG